VLAFESLLVDVSVVLVSLVGVSVVELSVLEASSLGSVSLVSAAASVSVGKGSGPQAARVVRARQRDAGRRPNMAVRLAACGATHHDTSLGLFDEGFVASACSIDIRRAPSDTATGGPRRASAREFKPVGALEPRLESQPTFFPPGQPKRGRVG